MGRSAELAWNLFVELRKEILETQRIRAQVVGFKITFVVAAIGVILSNSQRLSLSLLTIPALAAFFFDVLLVSLNISVNRIGYYCRTYLEPLMREGFGWSHDYPLWQEFMRTPGVRGRRAALANLGLTLLAFGLSTFGLFQSLCRRDAILTSIGLLVLFTIDVLNYFLLPKALRKVSPSRKTINKRNKLEEQKKNRDSSR